MPSEQVMKKPDGATFVSFLRYFCTIEMRLNLYLSQTDSQGHPLQEPYAAQRAGAQGPLLLQDFNLIDA